MQLLAVRAVTIVELQPRPGSLAAAVEVRPHRWLGDGEVINVDMVIHDSNHVDFSCSRGEGKMCEHAAAALYIVLSAQEEGEVAPKARWQTELEAALPPIEPEEQKELCLFLTVMETPKHLRFVGDRSALSMRPGVRGARGKWIRGDAKWQSLETINAPRKQLDAFKKLRRVLRSINNYHWAGAEWIDVKRLPGAELVEALERVHASGVAIVSAGAAQREVQFFDQRATILGVATLDDTQLTIAAELEADEPLPEGESFWLGEPPAGLVRVVNAGQKDEQLTLIALDRPLTTIAKELLHGKPLAVPKEDLQAFEEHYLPRLLQELPINSPDGSYSLPEPPRTTLKLLVEHLDDEIHIKWNWQRPVGLPQDEEEEQRILADIQDAAAELARLVWPELVPASRALPSASTDAAERPTQRANRNLPSDQILRQGNGAVFVAEVLPQLDGVDGLEVEHAGDVREYRAALNPTIQVRTVETGDWFDLHVTVEVEGEQVEFAELFTALSLGDAVFVLPSGTYFPLFGPEFDRLRAILNEARALVDAGATTFDEGIRVNRHNVDLWTELADLSIVTTQTSEWWQAIRQIADAADGSDGGSGELGGLARVDAPSGLRATLRDYQSDGLAWLHFLRTHRLGGILADDMGLGKTLQVIAMMEIAREEDPELAPFLVVAPTSVVSNWASECAKFAPGLKVAVISAMAGRRGKPLADSVRGAHVVLTSYALFRGEAEEYRALDWSGLVLDEAQQIKNPASHGHRAARMLGAPFTLVVTGTPLENNLLELWSLTSLAAPGLLGNKARFTEFYRTPIEKEQDAEKLALLQRRLRPFLLRRTKDLVAADLPPKQEQVLEIDLHPKHRKLYDLRFQRERQKILGLVGDVAGDRFQIFKSLTMLRQLALDPELVGAGSAPSAKLDALIELLTEAADEGHRVLVLSQFTRFLGAARDRAKVAGLESNYLDGSTNNRGEVIDGFRNGTAPVFFVSLKAGGFGLNLVEADYVVLLDPWRNPAVEAQAIDRAHRIGQERPVFVYRLVAANTIEQKVIALRESKAELFEQVLGGSGTGTGALSADDIRDLLAD